MTTREFESLKSPSRRQITSQKPRKSPRQLSTAFLLRTFADKYLLLLRFPYPYNFYSLILGRLCAKGPAKAKFCFGRGAALFTFFSQKITLNTSERDKGKDFGSLDGISRLEIT